MVIDCLKKLWKIEDANWLSKRQNDWNTIVEILYSEIDSESLEVLRDYFVYGKGANRIRGIRIFLFTPFESPEDAKQLYDLSIIDRRTREDLVCSYFRVYARVDELEWYREHCLCIAIGVYGNCYSFGIRRESLGKKNRTTPFIEADLSLIHI